MRLLVTLCLLFAALSTANAQLITTGVGRAGAGVIGGLAIGGPSSGTVNSASTNFTITLSGDTFNGAKSVTIADGSQGGTFTPSTGSCGSPSTCTVTPASGTSFTFTYTPVVVGAITLTVTNNASFTNPSPATYTSINRFTLTGPSTGTVNTASTNFTVSLAVGTFNGSQTVTIADGSQGGTFTPSVGSCGSPSTCTVTPVNGASSFTFTYTAAVVGAITLTPTNAQSWTNPNALTFTTVNTFTRSGPSSGTVNVASTNYTVTLSSGTFNGSQTITIADGAQGGTLTPSVGSPGTSSVTVTPTNGATSFTFTYTPVVVGAVTLTYTNAQSWTNPAVSTYTSINTFTLSGPGSGLNQVASTNFTVSLAVGSFNGSQTVTITDGSQGGAFTPSVGTCASASTCTVTPAAAATSFTFTYTPVAQATITLTPTNAQSWTNPSTVAYVSNYSGPGDFVASASGFWGLRAYNNAYATGSNKAANVCDTATLTTCSDVNILATGAFDVASAAALPQCATSCSVKTLYDQSGNSRDFAGSGAFAPVLTFNCVNTSLPCLTFTGANSSRMFKAATGGAQPNSVTWVGRRTSTTTQNTVFSANTGCETGFRSTANNALLDASTTAGASATDNVWHAVQGLCSSTSSVLNIDGTETTGLSVGTNAAASNWGLGERTNTTLFLTGNIAEVGFYLTVGFSSGNRTALCHNQRLYYGTSGTC